MTQDEKQAREQAISTSWQRFYETGSIAEYMAYRKALESSPKQL